MSFININKTCFLISGGLLILLLLAACAFMLKRPSNTYQANALIFVEGEKLEEPVLAAMQLSLVLKKSERKMYLYTEKKLSKTYKIALGFNPIGTKIKQGDGATPEGEYFLTHKNAKSKFYLSLGVSFPNIHDADAGLKAKLLTQAEHDTIVKAINSQQKPPQNTKLGGDIFLHGGGASSDWTWGCIALSNEDIKELFELLPLKTRIKIDP
jgi:murein L,D-transpeptidase YafK